MKTVQRLLKKLQIEIPPAPPIPLLGIKPKKMKLVPGREVCAAVFIAAVFTAAEIGELKNLKID